uniref:PCI domain-containing protein n=1 Tax=Globisporangium ultimum (strain ATCC 200006 / CBS 805.95 / DAOM BR144) TaxID=431595 RepID=K3WAZ5_GLOUD
MSDSEEYEYEYDSDEAYNSDEQLGGSDGEADEEKSAARETLIKLENMFYEAEDFRQRGDLVNALEYFQKVVALEKHTIEDAPENMKWSFQAYENIVKICVSSQQWDDMLANYQQMLTFLPYVTRNESTDSISSILDVVSASTGTEQRESTKYSSKVGLVEMYEITLDRLKDANNDRLWFNMNVKLGKLYLDLNEFVQLRKLLDQLYVYCQTPDGGNDQSKATALLDVYSLDIQLCGATKNSKKLREIYPKTLGLDAAVADPRVMGVVREEGGKMYLEEKQWMLAYNEFFESFRNYQEAGNARATQSLKYVVLSNMLASSDINPFDSREAKVYQDVEEIGAMLLLRGAYESNDIVQFEKILKNPKYKLLSDPIMNKYLNPLLRNIRCQVMKKLVRPYQIIQLASLAKAMNISSREVEDIAVGLIQNDELDAKIDQTKGFLAIQTKQES